MTSKVLKPCPFLWLNKLDFILLIHLEAAHHISDLEWRAGPRKQRRQVSILQLLKIEHHSGLLIYQTPFCIDEHATTIDLSLLIIDSNVLESFMLDEWCHIIIKLIAFEVSKYFEGVEIKSLKEERGR